MTPTMDLGLVVGGGDPPPLGKNITASDRIMLTATAAITSQRRFPALDDRILPRLSTDSSPVRTSLMSILRSERASSADRYRCACGLAVNFWIVRARSSGTSARTRW